MDHLVFLQASGDLSCCVEDVIRTAMLGQAAGRTDLTSLGSAVLRTVDVLASPPLVDLLVSAVASCHD